MARTLTAWLLAVLLLAGCTAALGQGEPRELVIANPTKLSGMFFTDQWGSNTADIDIRFFIHGQGTVAYLQENRQEVNRAVVQSFDRALDELGNATYTFTLREGLCFSDGSPVTARDFVGSVLIQAGPQIKALSGTNRPPYNHLLGQEAYLAGAETLAGLRLVDERTFSLTITADLLPYYNELSLVDVLPYPMAVLLPGTEVVDTPLGAGFSPAFDQEALAGSLLDPAGYLSLPLVSFGPYRLLSYDATAGVAHLELNPHYQGDAQGQKPAIQRIRLVEAANDTMVDHLLQGQIDLINKITWDEAVTQAREAANEQAIQLKAYSRRGLAYLNAASGQGPTASVLLRRALAHLIDRDSIITEALRSNGQPVFGYYGRGQDMVRDNEARLQNLLHRYPFSTKAAEELLIQDGWTLGADGQPLTLAQGSQRFRLTDGKLEPLSLRLAISRGNPIARAVASHLAAGFQQVGGAMEIVEVDSQALFRAAYRQGPAEYDLVFMGSNFGLVFDPSGSLLTFSGLADLPLAIASSQMLHTPPGASGAYRAAWERFQTRLVDQLPVIPLYSNTYYDAYTNDLINYHPENHVSVGLAILYASWR